MNTRTNSNNWSWIQLNERRATRTAMLLLLLLLIMPVSGAQAAVVLTTLHSFTGGNDGASPQAALVQGSDGYFYGTTESGGAYTNQYGESYGTVFKISTNGALTSLYSFTGGNDGASPQAALVQGSDGYFYGTTCGGGAYGAGTVFRISTNGALTTLYAFGSITNANGGALDGASPQAALVQGSDGSFYGTTRDGGTIGWGTVFKISTNGVLTMLYSFTGTNDGAYPDGALLWGSDGCFYGTTECGPGTNLHDPVFSSSYGTVFKISTNGALTSLYSFTGKDGAYPQAGLVQGSDGSFYGTTDANGWFGDGIFGAGTVFKISTNGVLTMLYSFTGGVYDANPCAALVQGSDGYFYGTTEFGGTNYVAQGGNIGVGTVFKISTNGALTTLYSFSGGSDGAFPQAALVQGSDGRFYGTTAGDYWWGGTNNGTVFRLTIVPEPQLTIIPSGPSVVLAWPTNYAGFSLQSTTNLGSSAIWTTNSAGPVVIGGQNVVINPISGRQQFYRLSQ